MTRTPARRLAEVATKVGVSEATVSRVLNGKPGVSDSTRETVLTALDVLGYERPSKLRGQRARLIGLVLPELQNPIFPALAEVIGGALAQRGFTPVLCTRTAGGLSEADYVELLLDQHASGVVFAGGHFADSEKVLEVGHRFQVTKWSYIQPDLQYVIDPGGTGDIPNAVVIGAQMGVTF